jgi:beta-phosphoglucomutase-like phosphatase (HAD superfamily)
MIRPNLVMKDLQLSEPLDGLEHQVRAVLFDCDGTLVDTMPAHHRSWEATLREIQVREPLDYDRFCSLGGMAGTLVAEEICKWFRIDHDPLRLAMRKRELFLGGGEVHPPIPQIESFARRVAATHPVAVVSGGHRPAVENALTSTGLRSLFEVIVTPEDVEHGKPAPDMYLLAAERLGVDPADCLVLEDGPPGVEAARRAGMRVVIVGPAVQFLKETN